MKMSKTTKRIFSLVLIIAMCLSATMLEVFAASNETTLKGVDADSRKDVINYINKKLGAESVLYHGLVPGLKQTVTKKNGSITTCSKMTPQGLTLTSNYIIISAYCNCGQKHNSVLYMLDQKKKYDSGSLKGQYKYLTTVILDTNCHVGGIARAGSYLWVCDSNTTTLRAYKFSDIEKDKNKAYHSVTKKKARSVSVTPSYICYCKDNKYIYEGKWEESKTSDTKICYYSRAGSKITKKGTITIKGIGQIQGISIRGGTMLLTGSYGKSNKSYIYRFKYKEGKTTYKKSEAQVYTMPNMLEACYISPTRTYCLFESAAKVYLDYNKDIMPMDHYVAIDNGSLGFKVN